MTVPAVQEDWTRLKEALFRRLSIAAVDQCWEWRGGRSGDYGYIWNYVTRRDDKVHRVAWEIFRGPIPKGLFIHHRCCNPICANPNHLEPITNRENILLGRSPIARNAKRTHCKRGHPFDEENTYIDPTDKSRHCRICRDRRRKEWRERSRRS